MKHLYIQVMGNKGEKFLKNGNRVRKFNNTTENSKNIEIIHGDCSKLLKDTNLQIRKS